MSQIPTPVQSNRPVAKDFLSKYVLAPVSDRASIVMDAQEKLSKTQMKAFSTELKRIEASEKEKKDDETDDGKTIDYEEAEESARKNQRAVTFTDDSAYGGSIKSAMKPGTETATPVPDVVTEPEAERFWKEIDSLSGSEIFSEEVLKDFQYVGFDPNVILKSVISKGRKAGRDNSQIMQDISTMCVIAIIKGSITDQNLRKMSDSGKKTYQNLEEVYELKKNGSKGVEQDVVSIARVGAAFPGSMTKLLMHKPELAKKFSGSFGSKNLPSYLRHQSAAACIPDTLEESAKTYLLGLITAFTSDQSRVITRKEDRKKPEEVFETQENFVNQTHASSYPSHQVRVAIFKSWPLLADYPKLNLVAENIYKVNREFQAITKDDLEKGLSSV